MHVQQTTCCGCLVCVPRATKTCPARYIRAAKDRVESGVRIRRADWCVMGARDNESERSAPFAQFQLMCTRLGPTSSGFPERHPKDVQPEYQLIFGSIRPSPHGDPAHSQGGQALTPLTSSAARITPADRVFTSADERQASLAGPSAAALHAWARISTPCKRVITSQSIHVGDDT